LILVWLAVSGGAALAQGQKPDLSVTLRDAVNAPLGGITVIVRDQTGTRDLAHAATDARGVATFSGLTESQVRVAIAGTLPNGTRFYHMGNDATGITLLLDPPPTILDLRSETDGKIVPDPATMAAREPGIPLATDVAVVPTAPLATPIPLVQASAPAPAAAPLAAAGERAVDTNGSASEGGSWQIWFGVALLVLLIGGAIGIIVVQRRAA